MQRELMSYAITSGEGMLIIEWFGFVCWFVCFSPPPPIYLSMANVFSSNVALSPIWYAYNLAAPDCSSAEWYGGLSATVQILISPLSPSLYQKQFSHKDAWMAFVEGGAFKKNNPKKQVWEWQMLEHHTVICSEMEQLETPGPIVQRLSALSLWPMASSPLIRRNSLTTNLE